MRRFPATHDPTYEQERPKIAGSDQDGGRLRRLMLPTLHRLELIVRPRADWLVGPWARMPVGIICLLLAIIITLPVLPQNRSLRAPAQNPHAHALASRVA